MRYARTREGDMFLSSTAVVMSELTKLIICLCILYSEEKSLKKWTNALHNTIVKQPYDTLKVCVPSLVYIIQNNLLYVSASHLDAATYQVTYQLKILTTAMFAVFILKKKLLSIQWAALLVLVVGVVLVQLAKTETPSTLQTDQNQNHLIGFSAALVACLLSGFAGIYFEKILKGSDISIWMRNIQLSLLSLPFGFITSFLSDHKVIFDKGFFYGYDFFIWYLVLLQACGGLIVAMVVKYADNILKGFATSLAIIISCVVSIYIFNFNLTLQFSVGTIFVICSIFMYSYNPKKENTHSNSKV